MEIIKVSETETLYKFEQMEIICIKGKNPNNKMDIDEAIRINKQILARQYGLTALTPKQDKQREDG